MARPGGPVPVIVGAIALLPLTWQAERSFFSEYNIPISPRTMLPNQINDLGSAPMTAMILDYDPSRPRN